MYQYALINLDSLLVKKIPPGFKSLSNWSIRFCQSSKYIIDSLLSSWKNVLFKKNQGQVKATEFELNICTKGLTFEAFILTILYLFQIFTMTNIISNSFHYFTVITHSQKYS